MKKSLLSILTLALVAVGCQNYDDQFDSLNASIASLTTKVNGIDTALAAQITQVGNNVSSLSTDVTALANSALTAADLTASLVGVLENIATVSAALTALDTQVASDIAGVNTTVGDLSTQLTAVQTAALTAADIAALDEVTNLNAEMVAVQAALDELLTASASVNGISISNQATLDYVETLIETDGTPESYIVNGDVNIVASSATGYDAGYTAAISAITARLSSVIGTVTITTASADATAVDIARLTYVSGDLALTGKMPSGFAVSTAASLALDVEEADITLASLTSAAGGVTISAGTTTITNVAIANLTNGAVTTSANTLALANADVNLGAGHPAATTTAKSLIGGNATDALTGATLTITNGVTLGSKVVTNTVIDAGGDVTLSNGTASSLGSSTITSGGNISISALTLGAAGASALTITTDGGSGGSITLGATSSGAAFTATASGSTVNAGSIHTIAGGVGTFNGTGVTLTALATNTTGLTVGTATSLDLPALANGTGKVTATAATSFSAPLYTSNGTIDLAAGATVALKAMTALADLSDIATISKLTLTAQDADLNLSTAVLMTELNYTPAATNATASSEDTDLTYQVLTSASSLTTVNLGAGGYGDVVIKAPLVTSLATVGDMRTFTTTGTALTAVTIGHVGINGGAPSEISVTDTKITSLDISGMKWLGALTVTGNTSMTAMTMPTDVTAANNANVATTGRVTVTITGNALTGTWTDAIAASGSQIYVEGSLAGVGLSGAKTWLNALLGNVVIATSSVTYDIEIDAADAAMETNKGVSVAIDGTSNIDNAGGAAELALLPN